MALALTKSSRQCLQICGTMLVCWTLATGGVRATDDDGSDEFETLQAREVLQGDDGLADLNLGIFVRRHVAVLWGPVPSQELKLRAEVRLRTMLPLADVRNELNVAGGDYFLPPASPPLSPPLPWKLPDIGPAEPPIPPADDVPLTPPGS